MLLIRKDTLDDKSFCFIDPSHFLALRVTFCHWAGCGLQRDSMEAGMLGPWRSLGIGSLAVLCVSDLAKLVCLLLFVFFQVATWREKKTKPPPWHRHTKPPKQVTQKTHYTLKAQKSEQKPQSADTLHTFNWVVSSWGYYKNKQTNRNQTTKQTKTNQKNTTTKPAHCHCRDTIYSERV